MGAMDIVVEVIDKASKKLEDIGRKAEEEGKRGEKAFSNFGIALAGIGAAAEGLARSQQDLTDSTNKLAIGLGIGNDEVRDLALEMTNVTFPLENVLSLMKSAQEQGLRTSEEIKNFANTWDMVEDATGESSTALAKSTSDLQVFGIEAENVNEALGAFGYITNGTSGTISDFMNFVNKNNVELRDLNLTVDQAAGLIGAMEHELGMTGRTARQEFRSAVADSDGTLDGLLETLGLSKDTFNEYTTAVKDSSDVIQENADAHGETYTPLEKIQQKVKELTYEYGEEIGVLGDLSVMMMTVGPMITALSGIKIGQTAATIATTAATWGQVAATTALNIALAPITVPILAIVAGFAALVAGGVLVVKNWDKIKAGAKSVFGWIGDFVGGIIDGISGGIDNMSTGWKNFWEGAKNVMVSPINFIIDGINTLIRGLNSVKFTAPDWVPVFGGKDFGFNVKEIDRFDTGGTVITDKPGANTLAMVKDGEQILAPGSIRRNSDSNIDVSILAEKLDMLINLFREFVSTGLTIEQLEVVTNLDGRRLARDIQPHLTRNIEKSRGGSK